MPRAPITNRQRYFEKLRDGSYRDLEFNLVNTELGAMIEPVSICRVQEGNVQNVDAVDASFDGRTEIRRAEILNMFGTSGLQSPTDYSQ